MYMYMLEYTIQLGGCYKSGLSKSERASKVQKRSFNSEAIKDIFYLTELLNMAAEPTPKVVQLQHDIIGVAIIASSLVLSHLKEISCTYSESGGMMAPSLYLSFSYSSLS